MTFSYAERDRELERIRRERGSFGRAWPVRRPTALYNADRHAAGARLILDSLNAHYFDCLASGRMEEWRKAAISAVELLASVPDAQFARRY